MGSWIFANKNNFIRVSFESLLAQNPHLPSSGTTRLFFYSASLNQPSTDAYFRMRIALFSLLPCMRSIKTSKLDYDKIKYPFKLCLPHVFIYIYIYSPSMYSVNNLVTSLFWYISGNFWFELLRFSYSIGDLGKDNLKGATHWPEIYLFLKSKMEGKEIRNWTKINLCEP